MQKMKRQQMKLKALLGITLATCSLHVIAATSSGKDVAAKNSESIHITTQEDKLSYSLGAVLAEQLKQFGGINALALSQGIDDTLNNEPSKVSREEMVKLIEEARKTQEEKIKKEVLAAANKNLKAGKEFLAENSKKSGVKTLKDGLQYKILEKGNGIKPEANDEVVVNYEGRLLNGHVFDSSYKRNQPLTFRIGQQQFIPGWIEGIKNMPQGSTWELYIPSDLAYGQNGVPGVIGPNSVLIFKVELKDVTKEDVKKIKS